MVFGPFTLPIIAHDGNWASALGHVGIFLYRLIPLRNLKQHDRTPIQLLIRRPLRPFLLRRLIIPGAAFYFVFLSMNPRHHADKGIPHPIISKGVDQPHTLLAAIGGKLNVAILPRTPSGLGPLQDRVSGQLQPQKLPHCIPGIKRFLSMAALAHRQGQHFFRKAA